MAWSQAYTSYDYASAMDESRGLAREKYAELKLEANFIHVTPAYSNSSVQSLTTELYTNNPAVAVTPLFGNGTSTNLYVVRHSNYSEQTSISYKFFANTTRGIFTLPQLGGDLTLSGRDSKWHVTDYQIGSKTVLYSTAEIFTWKEFPSMTILVVYGGPGETHELAIYTSSKFTQLEGPSTATKAQNGTLILNWATSSARRVVQIGDLFVYIYNRNSAYNLWVMDFENTGLWGNYSANVGNTTSVIIEAGYLIRNAVSRDRGLFLEGDLNATVSLNIIGAPKDARKLFFNGKEISFKENLVRKEWSSELVYIKPEVKLPSLDSLEWKYIDNLPEINSNYDDTLWTLANHTTTNNTRRALLTPTCLFASDYSYNSGGVLIYRGYFNATGQENFLYLSTQGGAAYGSSLWVNDTYLGCTAGEGFSATQINSTYKFTTVEGQKYVFTILILNNGFEENPDPGADQMKEPRGILDYELGGRAKDAVSWKLTGNFGGEQYPDKDRGPMNEGGLFAERQGWTQPFPPSQNWESSAPTTGIEKAGVGFWAAGFELDLPYGYDIPLTMHIDPSLTNGTLDKYRAWIWVNGYQYGKYYNHIGPQTDFPVPQGEKFSPLNLVCGTNYCAGIFNYHGTNWIAVEIWAEQESGARFANFTLTAGSPVLTSLKPPRMAPMPSFTPRIGAY